MPRVENALLTYPTQRKHRRFDLRFPVCLTFPAEGNVREVAGITWNVSVGGLLLKTQAHIPSRARVRVTIQVQSPRSGRPVHLLGEGEVVRVESLGPGAGFAVAVECARPIVEVHPLPAVN